MQVTNIIVGGDSLSLTYDKVNNVLTGDTSFVVTVIDVGNEPADSFYVGYSSDIMFIFSPGGVNASSPERVDVSINSAGFNLNPGNYIYNLTFTSIHATDLIIPIYLKVIEGDAGGGGETPRDYRLKYILENEPKEGEVFTCEIHQDQYAGEPINIEGRVELKYQEKTDHFQPIVASNLNLTLLANEDISLQDLYSEDEKNYKVYLKRNDQIIFVGFLKPDGIWEDYVYDRWELNIDAFDGLSVLKNMSFSGENGTPFSGRLKAFSIIYNCLKKTGLDLPINVNCEVMYDNSPGSYNTFETFYLNTERYYQSSSDPMDCESVLKSILQLFNATLLQHNGEWYIYRTIELTNATIFNRNIEGVFVEAFTLYPSVNIGSHINNFDLFHCNSNQKKSISPSVQAYRVVYQYGNANSVFYNSELKLSGSGLNIDGWTVHDFDGEVERHPSGFGLISKTIDYTHGDPLLLTLNQSIDINEGSMIKLIIQFGNFKKNTWGLRFAIKIGDKFFNIDSGQWQDNGVINSVSNSFWDGYVYPGSGRKRLEGLGRATYELVVKSPTSGSLVLSIYRDKNLDADAGGFFDLYGVYVKPNDSGNIKGKEYIAQRTQKKSTVTKPNITVYNGDSVSDLFVGTIYKVDADTPTDKWIRWSDPDMNNFKELLSINAEDNLRLSPRPMMIFEGDVYGFIPFISLISIDNMAGKKFQPTGYSFDTSTGILKLTSREFASEYLENKDFYIDVKENFGNETKVTIV